VLRDALRRGCNRAVLSICRGRSGEAFINHAFWNPSDSALIAMLDCVCGSIFPARAATQFGQAQFLVAGRRRRAAEIWIRIKPEFRSALIPFDQTAPRNRCIQKISALF